MSTNVKLDFKGKGLFALITRKAKEDKRRLLTGEVNDYQLFNQ